MYSMLRRSAVLVGLLAGFLAVGLVVPSAANAEALPQPKPMPANVRHLFSVPNQIGGSTLPVAPTPPGPGGQVIKGPWRLYPGTTKVIPPSLLKIVRGAPGIGLGIGSAQTASPLDYIRAGASWGCAFADFACSDAERQTKRDADLGVQNQPGVFGVPLFNDLWAWLTGQTSEAPPDWLPAEAQGAFQGYYCNNSYTYSGGNTGGFTRSLDAKNFQTPTQSKLNEYNGVCGPGKVGNLAYFQAVCRDVGTGQLTGASGQAMGAVENMTNYFSTETGAQYKNPCGLAPGMKLVKLIWFTKKWAGPSPSSVEGWIFTKPGIWMDPDASEDQIKETEITSTVQCKDGAGAVTSVTSKTGAAAYGGLPTCPAGSSPISYETSGGLPGQQIKIGGGGLVDGAEAQYPSCLTGGNSCAMNVFIDGQQCTVRVTGCADWSQIYGSTPSRVECKYGSYTVQGSDCLAVLKDAYKSETGVSWDPAYPNTAPAPTNHYNQWITPSPEPWNPTSPANQPAPGGSTSPAPSPFPTTGTNPQFNWDNCISGGGWSWNPVDWVAVPVSCVMQAMFKPDPGKGQQRADAMKAKMANVGVEPLITAVNTNITAIAGVAGGSGCSGPAVEFEASGISKTIYPFSACDQPLSTLAMFSNAMATMVLVVGGGFGMIRAVAMGFGFNFTMGRTGGGDS